jgi:hypothetical protein
MRGCSLFSPLRHFPDFREMPWQDTRPRHYVSQYSAHALQVSEFRLAFSLQSISLSLLSALAFFGTSQSLLCVSQVLLGPLSALFRATHSPGLAEIQGQHQARVLALTASAAPHRILKKQQACNVGQPYSRSTKAH